MEICFNGKRYCYTFGVFKHPYTLKNMAAPIAAIKAHEAKRRTSAGPTRNAENVAGILENKYGIIGTFLDIHGEEL